MAEVETNPESKYGDVKYGDPKHRKYPLDSPKRIRAAKSYFAMARNRGKYTPEEQEVIQGRIDRAMARLAKTATEYLI
jgi:hypothetical protein